MFGWESSILGFGVNRMNLEEIRELATLALAQPPGLGIPELERNPENFAPYLRFLYDVVDFYRIRMVIECGVYMGTASEYMAIAGGNNVFVIGIDIAPHPHAVNIVYPRHKNLALVHGDTLDIDTFERVGNLVGNDGVGLLFLDSSHDGVTPFMEYKLYKRFFADVDNHLKLNGRIYLFNIDSKTLGSFLNPGICNPEDKIFFA